MHSQANAPSQQDSDQKNSPSCRSSSVQQEELGTVDGGNLAPLEHKQAYSTPRPLFNIVRECGVLRTWSNDVNLAPPHLATVQC